MRHAIRINQTSAGRYCVVGAVAITNTTTPILDTALALRKAGHTTPILRGLIAARSPSRPRPSPRSFARASRRAGTLFYAKCWGSILDDPLRTNRVGLASRRTGRPSAVPASLRAASRGNRPHPEGRRLCGRLAAPRRLHRDRDEPSADAAAHLSLNRRLVADSLTNSAGISAGRYRRQRAAQLKV